MLIANFKENLIIVYLKKKDIFSHQEYYKAYILYKKQIKLLTI